MLKINGKTVALARDRERLTQRQLAALIDPNDPDAARYRLRRLEAGEVHELEDERAERLATALNMTLDDLGRDLAAVWRDGEGHLINFGPVIVLFTAADEARRRRDQLQAVLLDAAEWQLDLVEADEGRFFRLDPDEEQWLQLLTLELVQRGADLAEPLGEAGLRIEHALGLSLVDVLEHELQKLDAASEDPERLQRLSARLRRLLELLKATADAEVERVERRRQEIARLEQQLGGDAA